MKLFLRGRREKRKKEDEKSENDGSKDDVDDVGGNDDDDNDDDEEGEPEVDGRASAPARNYQTTFQAAPAALARL